MKTPVLVTLAATFVSILALCVFLISADKDIQSLLNALPGIAAALGSLFFINRVDKKVDTVQHQTNGTLSKLREEAADSQALNSALLSVMTPAQIATVPASILGDVRDS